MATSAQVDECNLLNLQCGIYELSSSVCRYIYEYDIHITADPFGSKSDKDLVVLSILNLGLYAR